MMEGYFLLQLLLTNVEPLSKQLKNIIMLDKEKKNSIGGTIILLLVFINAFILKIAFIENGKWYITLVITLPLLLIAVYNARRHAVSRKYPYR